MTSSSTSMPVQTTQSTHHPFTPTYLAFTDSAVDLDSVALSMTERKRHSPYDNDVPDGISISARLNQLAAIAWAVEQDDDMSRVTHQKLERILDEIETTLTVDQPSDVCPPTPSEVILDVHQVASKAVQQRSVNADERSDMVTAEDLLVIQRNLSTTIAAMRLRQQEQRHLYELTIQKFEAIANKSLKQTQSLKRRRDENMILHQTCRSLSKGNELLRQRVAEIESVSIHREVAVHAMSSAVAGLEGWINSSPVSRQRSRSPPKTPKKTVIRGRGRFRGKYLIEEPDVDALRGRGSSTPANEVHDGIRAWLRGFRDVEEELRLSRSGDRFHTGDRPQVGYVNDNDDWGEFVTITEPETA